MKTRRIPKIAKSWLWAAIVLVLALLQWVGHAWAASFLDKQRIRAREGGDVGFANTFPDSEFDLNGRGTRGWTVLMGLRGKVAYQGGQLDCAREICETA